MWHYILIYQVAHINKQALTTDKFDNMKYMGIRSEKTLKGVVTFLCMY